MESKRIVAVGSGGFEQMRSILMILMDFELMIGGEQSKIFMWDSGNTIGDMPGWNIKYF